jgi:predicted nicotinamide N-methyase
LFRPDAGLEELMALAGQRYELAFEKVSAGGVTLDILQIANMREILDRALLENALADAVHTLPLWAKIWPGSVILGHVLRHIPPQGRTALEIGAGCGLTGLVAAALGFPRVLITDINEEALLFARVNILRNGLESRAGVARLDIRNHSPGERFSLILGSEILYLDYLYRPLVKFLEKHLEKSGDHRPEAILAADHRRDVKVFFKRAEKVFAVSRKDIGVRESEPEASGGRPERHLITLYHLTPHDNLSQA